MENVTEHLKINLESSDKYDEERYGENSVLA